ncbi:MAG: TIGR03905 family TSCPD domain-containing protein [Clostridia bacterium]|nr:TIGR03905 family TSCPD domain-containing protein [Clostridia bacterium]
MFTYKTRGTCSTAIDLEIDDNNKITACKFHHGCMGNTEGLARMVIGRDADEVKQLLRGVPCKGPSSCPDQLSYAIEACQQQKTA